MGFFSKLLGKNKGVSQSELIHMIQSEFRQQVQTASQVSDFVDVYKSEKKWKICAMYCAGMSKCYGAKFGLSESQSTDAYLNFVFTGLMSTEIREPIVLTPHANFELEEKFLKIIREEIENNKWQGNKDAEVIILAGYEDAEDGVRPIGLKSILETPSKYDI